MLPPSLFVRRRSEASLRSVCWREAALFRAAPLGFNEVGAALPPLPSGINTLIYAALAVTGSTGQPGKRLFSGLLLFLVITVQVAALSSGSITRPQTVLQLESEREASDGGAVLSAEDHPRCAPPTWQLPTASSEKPRCRNTDRPADAVWISVSG